MKTRKEGKVAQVYMVCLALIVVDSVMIKMTAKANNK